MKKKKHTLREVMDFLDEMQAIKIMIAKIPIDILEHHFVDIASEIVIARSLEDSNAARAILINRLEEMSYFFEKEINKRHREK